MYARQLQEMEDLFKGIGGDDAPVNDAQMERAIRAAEVMVQNLEIRANELTSTKILHLFWLINFFLVSSLF